MEGLFLGAPSVRPFLELTNGPRIAINGHEIPIPEGSQRTLAFLALKDRRLTRRQVAGSLWPDGSDQRACGNLRSALWRLRAAGIDVLETQRDTLALRDDVVVDVHWITQWAGRLVGGLIRGGDLAIPPRCSRALSLLPGWYEDWVILERERVRCLVLHALEILSRRLSACGRHAEAVEAAITAICSEPLRESAQRALILAHAAEGNVIEARRALHVYAELLRKELGVEPSPELVALATRPRAHFSLLEPVVPLRRV